MSSTLDPLLLITICFLYCDLSLYSGASLSLQKAPSTCQARSGIHLSVNRWLPMPNDWLISARKMTITHGNAKCGDA
jgi:hypothetical protein